MNSGVAKGIARTTTRLLIEGRTLLSIVAMGENGERIVWVDVYSLDFAWLTERLPF